MSCEPSSYLAHVFNSVSKQHYGFWASQLPFLHSLRDVIPPSEACLYGLIKWSLAQVQQQSSMGLSQSFPSKRGWQKPGPGLGSIPLCKRDLCQGLVVLPWLRDLTWRVEMRLIQVARSLMVAVSPPVLLILGGRGAMGVSAPDVSCSSDPHHLHLQFSGWYAFQFLDQWISITSNRFALNMVWGNHLQLRSHPPLFYSFLQFNVTAAAAHHPIFQKEVDELLIRQ